MHLLAFKLLMRGNCIIVHTSLAVCLCELFSCDPSFICAWIRELSVKLTHDLLGLQLYMYLVT